MSSIKAALIFALKNSDAYFQQCQKPRNNDRFKMPFIRTKFFRCGDVLYLRNQRKKILKVFNSQKATLWVYCIVSTYAVKLLIDTL